jgi:hypothetical protein
MRKEEWLIQVRPQHAKANKMGDVRKCSMCNIQFSIFIAHRSKLNIEH